MSHQLRRTTLGESSKLVIEVTESWETPAGNERHTPIYEVEVEKRYLNKRRTVKARDEDEAETKARQLVGTWATQEIRKRIVGGKRDAKERAQAEAQRLDQEAKEALADAEGLLAATLEIDDRIDWEAERDTQQFNDNICNGLALASSWRTVYDQIATSASSLNSLQLAEVGFEHGKLVLKPQLGIFASSRDSQTRLK